MSRTVGPHITQLRLYPVFIGQALFQLRRTNALRSKRVSASCFILQTDKLSTYQESRIHKYCRDIWHDLPNGEPVQ